MHEYKAPRVYWSVAAWLGGQGGRGPPADFFEGAPKFKKGAKNLMKLYGSVTFLPAPRGWSRAVNTDASDANVSVIIIDK